MSRVNLLLGLCICALALLDGVNSALGSSIRPYLMGTFAASADELAWAPVLYFAAKLSAFLVSARLVEHYGERAVLLGGAALLALATGAAGVATSLACFVICQLAQGAAGGVVLAVGQGVLLRVFHASASLIAQACFAVSVLAFPVMIAPALAGWFAYTAEWSRLLSIAALFGALAWSGLCSARRQLASERRRGEIPFAQMALLVSGLALLVYALLEAARYAWDFRIRYAFVAAAANLAAFAVVERRAAIRLIDYHCFRFADFTFGICVSLLAGAALLGSSTALTMFAGGALGYTTLHSGEVQLRAAPFAIVALFTAALLLRSRIPPPLLLLTGIVLLGCGMWRLGFLHAAVAPESLFVGVVLRGTGLGLLFLTLTMVTLRVAPREHAIGAAGIFNFGRQLGGLIGLCWVQTLHEKLMSRGHEALGSVWNNANVLLTQAVTQSANVLRAHGAAPADAPQQAIALLTAQFQQQTFTLAVNGCFQALAMLFVFAFPCVVLTRILTERTLAHR